MTLLETDHAETNLACAFSPSRLLVAARWGMALVIAGFLLFAHGCHAGDHDDELFTAAMDLMRTNLMP